MNNFTSHLILCGLLFFSHSYICQNIDNKDCDINSLQLMLDTLVLDVVLMQDNKTAPFSTLYRVDVIDSHDSLLLNIDKHITEIETINKACWLYLLNHTDYDWKTNLFLYYIFERNAMILISMNPKKWRDKFKEKDISYWEEYLKNTY